MTAAVEGKELLERTLEGFRGFTSCRSDARGKGIIYGTAAWNAGNINKSAAMIQAYDMGRNA